MKLTVESVVRDYHVFKEVWDPWRGDQFCLQIEELNRYDRYTVAVMASLAEVSAKVLEVSKRVKHRDHSADIVFTTAMWTSTCQN